MRPQYYVLQGPGNIIKAFRAYSKADVMNNYIGIEGFIEADNRVHKSTLKFIKADPCFNIDRIIDLT